MNVIQGLKWSQILKKERKYILAKVDNICPKKDKL